MPNNIVKSIADQSGKSESEVEGDWNEAKKIVDRDYSDVEKDSEQYYKLVTSITKNLAGIKESILSNSFLELVEQERHKLK
jgi:hypothetical protein